jgi:hypothetical protein
MKTERGVAGFASARSTVTGMLRTILSKKRLSTD